ncbi:DnaJ-like protein [Chloropicon primus]|nr:DnaJ-like protein [Chloropicon primus]UPR01791.1 DnaJ-like protein [Chloropicon primus]|eukprot:QDZ22570.1 DnaJ-like protein [Chloropicon primus]
MFSEFGGKDAYAVLGIEDGPECSQAEIRKRYRKLALKWHPDKNKGSEAERAAREFDRVQKAYDVLTDEKAKEALDNYLKCHKERELRYQRENARRLKMVRELEERERGSLREKDEAEKAADQLERELNRLREKMSGRQGGQAPPREEATTSSHHELVSAGEKKRSLKVSWRKTASGSDYTVADLREIFGKFGSSVEDVVVRDKGTKGAAIVVLESLDSCKRALATVCGEISNPLLVVPLVKDAGDGPQKPKAPEEAPKGLGTSFENDVLAKLRAAAAAKKRQRDQGDQEGKGDLAKKHQTAVL